MVTACAGMYVVGHLTSTRVTTLHVRSTDAVYCLQTIRASTFATLYQVPKSWRFVSSTRKISVEWRSDTLGAVYKDILHYRAYHHPDK
jgi:hypothetical protein